MQEGLLRQRRNLFVVCALLWLMKYGGITLKKMSLAGFEVEFARPEALTLALWLVYAYFLYRYYQYFTGEGLDKLRAIFGQAINERCEPIIRRIVKSVQPESNDQMLYAFPVLRQNNWIYHGQFYVRNEDGSAKELQSFELPVRRRQLGSGLALAFLESTFRSSVVTDYLLPFALAGFVLWYCGSADWTGSFLHLFFDR
jgi:hypothetical protein